MFPIRFLASPDRRIERNRARFRELTGTERLDTGLISRNPANLGEPVTEVPDAAGALIRAFTDPGIVDREPTVASRLDSVIEIARSEGLLGRFIMTFRADTIHGTGDTRFRPQFRDQRADGGRHAGGGDQIGHFLGAVRARFEYGDLGTWCMLAHEREDERLPFGIRHLASQLELTHEDFQNFRAGNLHLIPLDASHFGTTYQDLYLTYWGDRFAELVQENRFASLEEAGLYLAVVLAEKDLQNVPDDFRERFASDLEELQRTLDQFDGTQTPEHEAWRTSELRERAEHLAEGLQGNLLHRGLDGEAERTFLDALDLRGEADEATSQPPEGEGGGSTSDEVILLEPLFIEGSQDSEVVHLEPLFIEEGLDTEHADATTIEATPDSEVLLLEPVFIDGSPDTDLVDAAAVEPSTAETAGTTPNSVDGAPQTPNEQPPSLLPEDVRADDIAGRSFDESAEALSSGAEQSLEVETDNEADAGPNLCDPSMDSSVSSYMTDQADLAPDPDLEPHDGSGTLAPAQRIDNDGPVGGFEALAPDQPLAGAVPAPPALPAPVSLPPPSFLDFAPPPPPPPVSPPSPPSPSVVSTSPLFR